MIASEKAPGLSLARVESFSDCVMSIIITIMVLDLKVPTSDAFAALAGEWPIFLAYALSFGLIGVYWVNHHRLLDHARRVTDGLVWSNLALLFALSLVPFATSYLGQHHFSRNATIVYGIGVLLPSLVYPWLQEVIRRTGATDARAQLYHQRTQRKGRFALAVYVSGIALTFVWPGFGIIASALVALFWMLPQGPVDRVFARN